MSFLNRLLKRISGQSRRYRARPRRPLSSFGILAAQVETLEVRTLLSSTFVVDSLTDTGTGSGLTGDIRYCIAQADQSANAGSTITFGPSLTGSTITLSQGQLVISDAMTITGPGASSLTISGNNSSRLFDVASGGSLTLENVTLTGGLAQGTGAAAVAHSFYRRPACERKNAMSFLNRLLKRISGQSRLFRTRRRRLQFGNAGAQRRNGQEERGRGQQRRCCRAAWSGRRQWRGRLRRRHLRGGRHCHADQRYLQQQ